MKIIKSVSLVFLLMIILAGFNLTIDAKGSDDILFYEDFDDYPEGMHFSNILTSIYIFDGIVEFFVYKATRFTYFNANYGNFEQYNFTNMVVKAKIARGNNYSIGRLKGSIGWGFHNIHNNFITSYDYECVWFIYQQGSPFFPWNGFWVFCRNSNGEFSSKKIEGFDIFDWHVYDINRSENGYDFYIDGEHVAQLTKGVSQNGMCLEIWNDNAVWYPSERNLTKYTKSKLSRLFAYIRPLNLPSRLTWGLIPVFHNVRASKALYIDYVEITG